MLLSFVLGKDVAVNSIIVKPKLKKWRENIHFDGYLFVSKQLNNKFALKYRTSKSGMPVNVKFNSKYFLDLLIQHNKGKYSF